MTIRGEGDLLADSLLRERLAAWDVMGRGVIQENEHGDAVAVLMAITDWRELCELMRPPKRGGSP